MPYKDKEKGKEWAKKWKKENHAHVLEEKRKWYKNNKKSWEDWRLDNNVRFTEIQRESYLKRKYHITTDRYNAMFFEQDGCCAICGKHQSEFKSRLNVDHDHSTNGVRALLCWCCNLALGNVNDDIGILQNMIIYLQTHNSDEHRIIHKRKVQG